MESSKARFLLLGFAVLALGIVIGTGVWLKLGPGPQVATMGAGTRDGLQLYGSVPDFSLTERSGALVSLGDLRGKIWIADFIYTTCTDTCPLQTATMAKLQEQYARGPNLQLVSFTVDPGRDTPRVLTQYAAKYHADPERWYFLTGRREQIMRLIRDGFHLSVGALAGDAQTSGMIPHSPRFVLVDKAARIRGYYDVREPEGLSRLKDDIDRLTRE